MSHPPSQSSSTTTNKPTFTLAPASHTDIARLTHIHLIALADDPPAQIKFPSSDAFGSAVSSMLEKQIGDPKWCIMKAVDDDTGEIGSWASWLEHSASNLEPEEKSHEEEVEKQIHVEKEDSKDEDEGKFSFRPGLGLHVMNHTNTLYSTWSSSHQEPQYLSLRACFTHPSFERRGMATALMRFGAQRADKMGVWTLVQASPRGKRIYEKVGFRVWNWLDVELGDRRWDGGDGGEEVMVDEKWRKGAYRFWYLERRPRAEVDERS